MRKSAGFTVVELIVICVVLGILVSIGTVAWSATSNRSTDRTLAAEQQAWLKHTASASTSTLTPTRLVLLSLEITALALALLADAARAAQHQLPKMPVALSCYNLQKLVLPPTIHAKARLTDTAARGSAMQPRGKFASINLTSRRSAQKIPPKTLHLPLQISVMCAWSRTRLAVYS